MLILAISHKEVNVDEVGKFHISPDQQELKLAELKELFQIEELMFLSTCNRVEWMLHGLPEKFNEAAFLARVYPNVSIDLLKEFQSYQNETAVRHAMKVASSMESMVVGEREIITQFRATYEYAQKHKLAGDALRVFSREVILNAKRVFSETDIASKPVSVVSIAFKEFEALAINKEKANVVVIGSGQTNTNFLRFLKKHYRGFSYKIFNRTIESAEALAEMVSGEAHPLSEVAHLTSDIDILIACTGAEEPIVDSVLQQAWTNNNIQFPAVMVDLGLPADIDPIIADDCGAHLISMSRLQPISQANLQSRHKAIRHCNDIIEQSIYKWREVIKNRELERALQEIPVEMKRFRKRAEDEIFASDLNKMDDQSRETVQKMLDYLEKKYVGIPYKITKSVFLNKNQEL